LEHTKKQKYSIREMTRESEAGKGNGGDIQGTIIGGKKRRDYGSEPSIKYTQKKEREREQQKWFLDWGEWDKRENRKR